jgi:hypothetical protein
VADGIACSASKWITNVYFVLYLMMEVFFLRSQMHASDAENTVVSWGPPSSTSSGTIRAHFVKFHCDEWISGCIQLKFKLSSVEGRRAKEDYLRRKGGGFTPRVDQPRQPYSNEGFVDAITEFIIADDQVRTMSRIY